MKEQNESPAEGFETRAKIIDEYLELDIQEKHFAERKKGIRKSLLLILRNSPVLYEDCKIQKRRSVKIDEEKLLEWIKDKYGVQTSAKLSKVSINIDQDKLEEAIESGLIDPNDIPSDCYSVTETEAIITKNGAAKKGKA